MGVVAEEVQCCSHDDCPERLPRGTQFPGGWTVARVEEFGKNNVRVYYVYLCPAHVLTTVTKQISLFTSGEAP